MKTVHLSTSDISGGAARAAYRLHQGLKRDGEDSVMFVQNKSSSDEHVIAHDPPRSFLNRGVAKITRHWLSHRLNRYEKRPDWSTRFSQARTANQSFGTALPDADVYHLHWINDFVDPLHFFRAVGKPVVWTLHDMNTFTGGCHYNVGCRKFEQSCGQCPQLGSSQENDLSRSVWRRKRKAYRQYIASGQLQIVAASHWLAEEARQSALLAEAPVRVIHHGLDHETFQPRDTNGVRSALGIPDDHPVVLFVALSTENHRKGFDLLRDALSAMSVEATTLLTVGGTEPDVPEAFSKVHLGRIESDLLLSVFYSLADIFVIPSRQEAFGQTALEAMACGTPVVGFDTGGIPDMVRSGETGWLAEKGDVRSLREAVETALVNDEVRRQISRRCRELVEEEFKLEDQARSYKEIYKSIIKNQK